MKKDWTPGPWRTNEREHEMTYEEIKIKGGGRTICTIWIDDAPVHDFNAEQSANARLITAAPAMVEALKKAEATLDEVKARRMQEYCSEYGTVIDTRVLVPTLDTAIAEIRAALALATGGKDD